MKFEIWKLGTRVSDSASGKSGELTHVTIAGDMGVRYWFQPAGLNRKSGKPLDVQYLTPDRVIGGIESSVDLPSEVLGTTVADRASGFSGVAVGMVMHMNGCVHIDVQPNGLSQEDGSPVDPVTFDIRRLVGNSIRILNDAEIEQSKRTRPSPIPVAAYRPSRP